MKGLEAALQRELEEQKLLDHLHNVRSKTLSWFSEEFVNSVKFAIPQKYAPLVADCRSLGDFAERLRTLRSQQQQEALVAAAQPFCDRYGLASGFWVQQGALDDLNAGRNAKVQCGVKESAAELTAAFQKGGDSAAALPGWDSWEPAWALILGLCRFGDQHASELDRAAAGQLRQQLEVTARMRQQQAGRR